MLETITCVLSEEKITPLKFNYLHSTLSERSDWKLTGEKPDLWCVNLDYSNSVYSTCFAELTIPEQDRANRFKHKGAKHQFVVGHGILHLLLKAYLNKSYKHITWRKSEHHKPFVVLPDGFRPIEFNLSHCENYILIGLDTVPVGVDIEPVRQLEDFQGICRQVFTAKEISHIQSVEEDSERLRLFFKHWTAKEAALKADGTGFMQDPKSIELEFRPESQTTINRTDQVNWSDSIQDHFMAWSRKT